jgi:hypothetical protein
VSGIEPRAGMTALSQRYKMAFWRARFLLRENFVTGVAVRHRLRGRQIR